MNNAPAMLRQLFNAALAAADPATRVPEALSQILPLRPTQGRTIVLGAGKASAAMAAALESCWHAPTIATPPLEGLVITRYGHARPCQSIEIVEAAHPVPDQAGLEATQRQIALAEQAGAEDLVICLISGGGSALCTAPAPGIEFQDKQALHQALLMSGASIHEMNTVRMGLSAVKGGRLAQAAAPARVISLLISDVSGDDPAVIASGPTVPHPHLYEHPHEPPLEILARHGIEVSAAVRAHLQSPAALPVTSLPHASTHIIATPQQALESAARKAQALGVTPHILSDRLEGDARALAGTLGEIALQSVRMGQPFAPPCVLLSGGETTVAVRGDGRGGRNVEFLLALALRLNGAAGVSALACDTDGVDGVEEVAGAWIEPSTLARAQELGLDARGMLENNDGHGFFEQLQTQIITGATYTNVNDFRAMLVYR